MSFISIIETIGTDALKVLGTLASLGVQATPVVTAFNPAAGAVLGIAANAILEVEQLIPGVGKGPQRKPVAQGIIMANLPEGTTLTPAQLDGLIEGLVTTFNALAGKVPGAANAAKTGG